MQISFVSAKGGQCTTTTMVGIATCWAKHSSDKIFIEEAKDVRSIFGMPYAANEDFGYVDVAERVKLFSNVVPPYQDVAFRETLADFDSLTVLVTRACYLSLKHIMDNPVYQKVDGIIVVQESGRALDRRDVEDIVGVPVIATVPWQLQIQQAVDAGTLARREQVAFKSATQALQRLAAKSKEGVA